jgi:hypothetical protein
MSKDGDIELDDVDAAFEPCLRRQSLSSHDRYDRDEDAREDQYLHRSLGHAVEPVRSKH